MKRALVWMLTGMMFLSVGCAQTLSAEKTASEEPKVIDMETGETDKAPEKELPKRTKAGERLEEIQKSGVLLIGIHRIMRHLHLKRRTKKEIRSAQGLTWSWERILRKNLTCRQNL